MDEEAKLRIGLDASPVEVALRKAERSMTQFGQRISDQFAQFGRGLLLGVAGGGMAYALDRIIEKVGQLKAKSEALGFSTDFLQDLHNVAMASEVASEKVDEMLTFFVKSVPAGADVEKTFWAVANQISATADPAERLRLAIEWFGRKGGGMVSILKEGEESVKEFAKQFSKLTEAEVSELDRSKQELERWGNWFTTWLGKAAAFVSQSAQGWATLGKNIANAIIPFKSMGFPGGGFSPFAGQGAGLDASKPAKPASEPPPLTKDKQEELNRMIERRNTMTEEFDRRTISRSKRLSEITAERSQLEEELAGFQKQNTPEAGYFAVIAELKILEIDKERLDLAKEFNKQREKLRDIDKEIAEVNRQAAFEKKQHDDQKNQQYMPTLEQIAQSRTYWRVGLGSVQTTPGPFAGVAQELLSLPGQIVEARLAGNQAGAQRGISRIEHLRSILRDAGLMESDQRQEQIAEASQRTADHLRDLINKRASIAVEGVEE